MPADTSLKRVFPLTIQRGMSQSDSYILMLGEAETGTQIPIFIGGYEAQSILLAQEHVDTRRPMTHMLLSRIMQEYALSLVEVTIDRVSEGIFYATLHVSDGFSQKRFDSRTSGSPIFVASQVLEECGVPITHSGQASVEELEARLRRCEENEEYEQAAEIQKQIDELKNSRQ